MLRRGLWRWVFLLAAVGLPCAAVAQEGAAAESAVTALMKRGLYHDAVRTLLEEIRKRPEPQAGRHFLMLGESYYQLKEYGNARPYFLKALRHCSAASDQVIAEYRLACCAYRLGDAAGALKRIDAFVEQRPSDRRSGTLLLFKMKLLAARGKAAETQIEAVHKQITDKGGFGSAARLAADKVLTEYYLAHGQEEKAKQRYASIVHNFRSVISQYAQEKRPVPQGMEQAHDHAAMQLGVLSVQAQRFDEAIKWLENVRYDAELKRQARLLLAQVAYQRRDFDRAASYLTRDGLLETVPAGALRSDMCLLLGLCQKSRDKPDPARVEAYLKQVEPASKGYFQAQAGLGDLYRERGLVDRALRAYANAAASPKYEAHALFHLGELTLAQAARTGEGPGQAELYRQAAEHFSQLSTKYPDSGLTKEAAGSIDALLAKGFNVSVAASDEEKIRRWQQAARDKPGSGAAARALINIARLYHKSLLDEKVGTFVKAPNHLACAATCQKLLDAGTYTGKELEASLWKGIQAEAHYYRGMSHLASVAPPRDAGGTVTPTYVKRPDLEQAIQDFQHAQTLVDPKRLDMVRSVEIALLEAMFKSGKPEHRQKAEARFAELVNEYGTDVRFQMLAMELAEWCRRQGRYADAAREYKGIAQRGANLPQEDVLQALFLAGKLYSQAALEAAQTPGKRRFGIYIYPKEVFQLDDLRKTYPPLRKQIRVVIPQKGIEADKALRQVSQEAGVPFVWSPVRTQHSVSEYLRSKRVTLRFLNGTVAEFLEEILDFQAHRLAFDVGMTGGEPTLTPKPPDAEAPDRAERVRTIEIYDVRREAERYAPLAHRYGAWKSVHGQSGMMFHVIRRIEQLTDTKVLWAEGVPKEDVLAAEFSRVPDVDGWQSLSCGQTLARLLAGRDLRFKVVPRDLSTELYDQAKECFNEIRKIDPKSRYGENSLFLLALNFYRQEDYERMKAVLRHYLRLFDSPGHEHHHEACFWVGWAFEHERRYRDACRWYNRAAEERLVVYRPGKDEKPPSRDALKAQLSYETLFALGEPVGGELKGARLENELVEFVRLSANVAVRVDASATGIETPIHRKAFQKTAVLDVLLDALESLGLSFRAENVNEAVARKALYRLASAYKKDGQMPQALASCNVLLGRYAETPRRIDAWKLKLEIYKALKDYRSVLATLEQLKSESRGEIEPHKIDFEIAWICFDLCRYEQALEAFKRSLAGARDPAERLRIRDGYARTLFRSGDRTEALHQYRTLAKAEPEPLRAFVDRLMVWYLELAAGDVTRSPLPAEAAKLIEWYTSLPDEKRSRLPQSTLAQVTWIYYVAALRDLDEGRTAEAMEKLKAAGNSPDDWLAADAIYRTGMLQMKARQWKQARETFEYLLFSTRSAEAEVKATYALGLCHQALGDDASSAARFEQVLKRFPDSAYADRIRAEQHKDAAATKPKAKEPAP